MKKSEILSALETGREEIMGLIEGLSSEEMEAPGVVDLWSVKDILLHLSLWEGELVKLLWQAKQGQQPTSAQLSMLLSSEDEINARWQQMGAKRSLDQVLQDFHAVRSQTRKRVEAFTDEDLANPKRYSWLGGKALWEWIEGDSFGHEAEHAAQIRAWLERRGRTA
jgi:hypothetical protein